jgi:prepilin-type N-terminal cleavage/methylation domain-containing protein
MIRNSHGFSLVELMVVIAILAIMAMVTAPSLVTGLPTYRIKAAVRDCTSQLRNARQLAIKDKRNINIVFDADSQFFEFDGRRFPVSGSFEKQYGSGVGFGPGSATEGVDGGSIPSDGIALNNDDGFVFTARGLADFGAGNAAGAIYFTNNRGDAYAVAVNAAGAVALLRWRGSGWTR